MQVQIAGKKLEVGAALQERISFGLESRVSKYFNRTGEAFVTVSKPGWGFTVDCSIHLPSGVTLQAHGEGDDGYQAFEMALDKIEKRVRRYKNRLRDHRSSPNGSAEIGSERIILTRDETDEPDDAPGADTGLEGAAGDSAQAVISSARPHADRPRRRSPRDGVLVGRSVMLDNRNRGSHFVHMQG